MTASTDAIVQDYLQLALAIEQHKAGYVDAYHGPAEWRAQAEAAGPRPLAELAGAAAELAAALTPTALPQAQRRDFLTRQVRAMQTTLAMLQGQSFDLVTETEALFDISPGWVAESIFEAAQVNLAELLPPGDSLVERVAAHETAMQISLEADSPLLSQVVAELRHRSQARFPLPPGESFEVKLVRDEPWSAYNWYLGNFRSRIEINTDLPITINDLVEVIAHEGYPGHHTELVAKEANLIRDQGWLEHTIILLDSPSCVVAEGIATRALTTLMTDGERVDWYRNELFPRAGLAHLEAGRIQAIETARQQLAGVPGNAAFLMFEHNAADAEILAYIQRYRLSTAQEAGQLLRFLKHARSYTFTYFHGGKLLDDLLAQQSDRDACFARLLREAVTPSQIRAGLVVG
jgi:hypothetical protein